MASPFLCRAELDADGDAGRPDRHGGLPPLEIAPWLRRLITRLIALVPAVLVIGLAGEQSTQQLLVLSQVILSLQLSFAVIPLIHFTSNRRNMGASRPRGGGRCWPGRCRNHRGLNGKLVLDQIGRGSSWRSSRAIRLGPVPLVAGGAGSAALTAASPPPVWVTLKPWFDPRPPGRRRRASLDWGQRSARAAGEIGVALEHERADAEILNRA